MNSQAGAVTITGITALINAGSIRNILAIIATIDPLEVFPDLQQSERRIRFRENPFRTFLESDDREQQVVAEIIIGRLATISEPSSAIPFSVIPSL